MSKFPMRVVMLSGHFDPFHDGHLNYFWQVIKASNLTENDLFICVISTDEQLLRKKGKVNIPQKGRQEIVHLILRGLGVPHRTVLNIWDTKTTLVAQALRIINPDILFRGGDKSMETMPAEEWQVCEELGILIKHAEFKVDRHGSRMEL